MVKSQSMEDLVLNDGLIVTSLANGKVLSHVMITNLRPAPSKKRRGKNFLLMNSQVAVIHRVPEHKFEGS